MASTPPPDLTGISEEALRYKDLVRSPEDLQRLSDFDRRIYLPLMLSAILPIVVAAGRAADDSGVTIAVNLVAWFVFVVDLVVHTRLIRHYLRSSIGIFDLVVVIITAPWFLIPGFGGSQILVVARLARLIRLLFVSKAARRAASRLGKVGIFSLAMLLFSSWMAYVAEHPTNKDFATFGDALWWGIVTLTTVGYGDIVPITQKGRIAGTALMLTGIATLGLISGTLASVFAPGDKKTDAAPPSDEPLDQPLDQAEPATVGGPAADSADLVTALSAVRAELAAIEQRLASLAGTPDLPEP